MEGRTASDALGYVPPEDDFDPLIDDFESQKREYTHFDLRLNDEERKTVRADRISILTHAYWPLLGFTKTERRIKRDENGAIKFQEKAREIKFGSHRDAALYEHYTRKLSLSYEAYLIESGLSPIVLAYRKGTGSNITQARSLFDEIRERRDVVAIALDISGFFDHISHAVLKNNLSSVLGCDRLPDHHFSMFRRMTKFEWVDADALSQRLEGVRKPEGRLCDAYQFRKLVKPKGRSLLQINKHDYGIPQGTPLSGLYANISMIIFDHKVADYVAKRGGSVRRYSDDIAILLPVDQSYGRVIAFVRDTLADIGLSLSEKKTEICHFRSLGELTHSDRPFQYLGFTFDGKKTLIRQSSLTRYYRKMHAGIYAKVIAAKNKGIPQDQIFMRELYKKYTHFGFRRNFPRYAYRASELLDAPEIRKQISNHFTVFKKTVRSAVRSVYG